MTHWTDVFDRLHANLGGRLFTATVLDRQAGLARRAYSSHPVDYPVSGTKPMAQGDWTRMVIEEGQTFVANSVEEFATYFADHALIESLGCQSALNVPLRGADGQVTGTINILDVAGYFTRDRVAAIQTRIATHRPAILAAMAQVDLHD
ncbi:GAF domain-containing protein [Sulfitobacter sp. S190]|uniref:GAF domain-containing protein n=1 Tax=Sulfitobacter sp. S190 TaxID=2867022 RepID=UPI0021A3D93D|nr:GAF domain-containing protein [Sulfitobacter sp. S190]UWR21132.1 GAF domain-containing protein [Sulfitobacter sp. S190]